MKKWSLALILSMAILVGCGSNQSSAQTTEANVEVKDNRTETEKSGGSGSTVVDNRQKKETASAMSSKSVSDEDFEKTGYIYENSIGDSLYFYMVKNNSAATVEINGNATAYDSAGSVIGASQRDIDVLGPGETSLMVFYFDSVSGIDKVDCALSYDTSPYYKPVINNIRMEQTINDKNITIRATNDGEYNAQFVEAYALFFDSDGKVIAYDSKYVTDNDSEIKPGATLSAQLSTYNDFDHVEYTMSYDTDPYYGSVLGDIEVVQNINDKNVVVTATNKGTEAAKFVEAYALFLDSSGNVVEYGSTYITDGDSEIKPGATLSKQLTAYEPFDMVELYLTGRKGGF